MILFKYLNPVNYIRRGRKIYYKIVGDVFANSSPITDGDFEIIKRGIDETNPKLFVEIGTGTGVSASLIFRYLNDNYPECEFYTIDIFKKYSQKIGDKFKDYPRFHALYGLSVKKEETTDPALKELIKYHGPTNILRQLLSDHSVSPVDIAFIDSRKGAAVAEFQLLAKHLAPKGIVFCHDVLNNGKGVEVLQYLEGNQEIYNYDIIDTGKAGIIRIKRKK